MAPAGGLEQVAGERDEDRAGEPGDQGDSEQRPGAAMPVSVTATMTAKAGSYSTIADAAPMTANTTYSCATDCTCDQATHRGGAEHRPGGHQRVPAWRSSHRPTGTDIDRADEHGGGERAGAVGGGDAADRRLIGPSSALNA